MASQDKRLVKTAVVDGPDSEEPVLLPVDLIDLDEFRSVYDGRTFWCGFQLGGCGRQLFAKRYTDRVCHFAHDTKTGQGRSDCSRDAQSADHLYIKTAIAVWLAGQGFNDTGRLIGPHLRDVEFTLGSHRRIRVQLSPLSLAAWRLEQSQAMRDGLTTAWIVRENHAILDELATTAIPAVLIECETTGSATPVRQVRIGDRDRFGHTSWTALEYCVPTAQGSPVPSRPTNETDLGNIMTGPSTGADALPSASDLVQVLSAQDAARQLTAAASTWAHQPHTLRPVLEAACHIRATLPSACTVEELDTAIAFAQDILAKQEARIAARRKVASGQPQDLELALLRGRSAARVKRGRDNPETEPPSSSNLPQKVNGGRPAPRIGRRARTNASNVLALRFATQVRDELIRCAEAGTTTTWAKVCIKIGSPRLGSVDPEELATILTAADRPTPIGQPLLSTLLAVGDPACLPAFHQAAKALGRTPSTPESENEPTRRRRDVQILYHEWGRK